jgi:hypothetical protein
MLNLIIALVLGKNAYFFAKNWEKWLKIVNTTSTIAWHIFSLIEKRLICVIRRYHERMDPLDEINQILIHA